MLQLKVFYSIPEGVDRCEVIFNESIIQNFEDLMQVIRGKIESLQFIPDTELPVLYTDDENTVTIRPNDSFHDAWRCASKVQGTTFCLLKIKISWQPKSTPELISVKCQQMREGSETDRERTDRKLKFGENCSKHLSSTPKSLPNTSSEADLIPDVGTSKTYLSPP